MKNQKTIDFWLFVVYYHLIEYSCLKFIYFQSEESLKALGTTMLLASEFESKEILNVLDKHFPTPFFTQITVSKDGNSLAMAIVDSSQQIKAQFEFKLEEMDAVSQKIAHPWELLKTPKSIKVSIECCLLMIMWLGSDRKKLGFI